MFLTAKTLAFSYWWRFRHFFSSRLAGPAAIFEIASALAWIVITFLQSTSKGGGPFILFALGVMFIARIAPPLLKLTIGEEKTATYRRKRDTRFANCIDAINKLFLDPALRTESSLRDVRKKILECVVELSREYRNDLDGTKIYSNLLIREGDEIIVIARDSPTREENTRYRKDKLFCNQVFDDRKAIFCGDTTRLNSDRELEYKSFMALPIVDHRSSSCFAVVTIDSTEFHHFDDISEKIETMLRPYTRILATTFLLK